MISVEQIDAVGDADDNNDGWYQACEYRDLVPQDTQGAHGPDNDNQDNDERKNDRIP